MNLMKKFFLMSYLSVFGSFALFSQSIDDLAIPVKGTGRQYVFTNKEAGTYHGEVNGGNSGGWQGWFVQAEKIFHDYTITVKGSVLDRTTASSMVYPYKLVRTYPNKIVETVSFADSINVLLVHVSHPSAELILQPAEFFRQDSLRWQRTQNAPSINISALSLKKHPSSRGVQFAIAADTTAEGAHALAVYAAANSNKLIARRKERMQRLLSLSPITTSSKELNKALGWAKIQIDALIMNQSTGRRLATDLSTRRVVDDSSRGTGTKGIFAGLPWFNNYWGRDSFISLPGATYVIGNFTDARDILKSYASFQERDSTNSNFGRIPNLATPQSVIYNTADGSPWFVKSLYEYVKYTGDIEFIKEMYPVVVRSIEGTIQYHCDSLGFLTHADAESWMDAVGPSGPWSPRGNRACDIQALWHQQLMVGVFCAEYFNDFHRAAQWKDLADKLEQNFRTYFIDTTGSVVYDHLNSDGSPSTELRPNQLFTVDMAIPERVRQSMVDTVIKSLVFEHGTATLLQADTNFHPFHEYPPYYVKDAAYHNGIVWTWLNGAAVYAATRYDLQDIVYPVTKNSIHQMLNRGTAGTLSELLDAHPRPYQGSPIDSASQIKFYEPKLSGTYSQAWSLAEFIRSMYQDYFGVSVDVPSNIIRIQPKLPSELTSVDFEQRIGGGSLSIKYRISKGTVTVTLRPNGIQQKYGINYLWVYPNGTAVLAPVDLVPGKGLVIKHTQSTLKVSYGKETVINEKNNPRIFLKNFSDKKYFRNISLARPELGRAFPVLRGPSHPLLTHRQVKAVNSSAHLLADASDPAGDDSGTAGVYQYPLSHHFKNGILDITRATFRYDEKNLYVRLSFNNLYDPGWHPEYGFQLTFAAIAINTGNGNQTNVGSNSHYRLDSVRAYDKLILIGGGIRVLDSAGSILCEYIPTQEALENPLGNTGEKLIEFAVPLEYLGAPNALRNITVLVGAQDDHGGAGIGEFRAVEAAASEWLGGGKQHPNDSNVFDVLYVN